MSLTITRDALMALGPCNPEKRMPGLAGDAEWGVREALDAGVSVEDILWVVARLGRRDLCVRFALLSAQRVAHLNGDPRVQAALDAAQAWLDCPSPGAAWAAAGVDAWAAGVDAWAAGAAARDAGAGARDAARAGAGAAAARAAGAARGAAAWAAEIEAQKEILIGLLTW